MKFTSQNNFRPSIWIQLVKFWPKFHPAWFLAIWYVNFHPLEGWKWKSWKFLVQCCNKNYKFKLLTTNSILYWQKILNRTKTRKKYDILKSVKNAQHRQNIDKFCNFHHLATKNPSKSAKRNPQEFSAV